MTLNIDITDCKSNEIRKIMETYPYGQLEIKFERVQWITDSSVSTSSCGPEDSPANRGNPQPGLAKGFQGALDVLGGMMGPPQAPRQAPQQRR